MQRSVLQEHIFSTYLTLRYGIIIIGALLPIVVWAVGQAHGVPLQPSISDYYWAPSGQSDAPSRNWFVGGLFAVAAFLYLYKGFTKAENIALNLAAIFAVGVAVFPTEWACGDACKPFSIHGFCAVSMFACLVYVVWFRARDTLSLVSEDATPSPAAYRRMYGIVGGVMLASPLTALILKVLFKAHDSFIFFIEAAGIWAFAAYWIIKSSELRKSAATAKALDAEIETQPGRKAGPLTPQPLVEKPAPERAVAPKKDLKG